MQSNRRNAGCQPHHLYHPPKNERTNMSKVGFNVSAMSHWDGDPWFTNCLRVTEGIRQDKPTRPDSGNVEFNDQGMITKIPNGAMISPLLRDGHQPGEWAVFYRGEPYTDFDVDNGTASGHVFTKENDSDVRLNINCAVGQDPNLFSCSHVTPTLSTYRDLLIEDLSYASVLRWMDCQWTNHPKLGDRPSHLAGFLGHEGYGVDVKTIIDVSIKTDTRPWVCMHHSWSDEFTHAFFSELQDAGLSAIVEGGNENWHGRNDHGDWANKNSGGNVNARVWALEQFIERHTMAKFYGHSNVFCNQRAGISSTGKVQLGNSKALVEVANRHPGLFEAFGINAYFGNGLTLSSDYDDNLVQLEEDRQRLLPAVEASANLARANGYKCYAYESGQHMTGTHAIETNYADGMEHIYHEFVRDMASLVDLNMLYCYIRLPRKDEHWGILPHAQAPTSPKWRGTLSGIDAIDGIDPPKPNPNPQPDPDPDPKPDEPDVPDKWRLHDDDVERIAEATAKRIRGISLGIVTT